MQRHAPEGYQREAFEPIGPSGRKGGRPLGSRNKPKNLIQEVKSLRETLGPHISPDDLNYLLNYVEGKGTGDLERDIDIFLGLQLKALLPIIANEISTKQLSAEATRRSGTVKEILAIRVAMSKADKNGQQPTQQVLIQNFINERLDSGRLAQLLGSAGATMAPDQLPVVVSGNSYDVARVTDEAGAVPDQLPERQEQVQAGGEE